VGGAVRDLELARASTDLDLVIDGDPRRVAQAIARRAPRAAHFALSEGHGAWRVVAAGQKWQIDIERLRAPTLDQDLAMRDFTINAIAQPLGGGEPIDPLGGIEDLAAGRLRMASDQAFAEDPLRVLRLARISVELGLRADRPTMASARLQSHAIAEVSAERIFMELRRIIAAPDPIRGLQLLDELAATEVVLPELERLRGIEQSHFHHLDVHGHTLEVLRCVCQLQSDPAATLGQAHAGALEGLLAEPLSDELTRGDALRWGALLHDAAKPLTRAVNSDGRVTFIGHDSRGAELARDVLGRLRASSRTRSHVALLVANHLRLGFLVHETQPLARSTVFDYLTACAAVEVDVTLLSVADRLATRGKNATAAIEKHLRVAKDLLGEALRWHTEGPPPPLWRGDDLARELHIEPGPRLGDLLKQIARARYAGEISDRAEALAYARELEGSEAVSSPPGG